MFAAGVVLFVPFSQLALGVNYDYTLRTVALGGALLGVVSGVLGSFAVLRRESLIGDALSHAALPGVGIAFLIAGRSLGVLLIGAAIASWLGVRFINALTRTTRIKQDTAMGIVLAAWFALGIALLTYIQSLPNASQAGLDKFIFGQAAAIVESDVQLIAVVGAISFVVLGLFWKEFKLITFDFEFAAANGFRVGFLGALLSTLIVVAIVLGLQLAGVILMVGMLIAPGIAARQWTHKLGQMVLLSGVFGAFAGGVGAILSALDVDLPTGPMIIVVAFAVVLLSLAVAPDRGLLWTSLQRRSDARRFAAINTLNDIYRYAEAHGGVNHTVPSDIVIGVRGRSGIAGLRALTQDGMIVRTEDGWRLTDAGADTAGRQAESLRLWDVYRTFGEALDLPAVPEDRLRDIRDVLSPDDIEALVWASAEDKR
ncbi:MAG: metal ABC transporter permease [Chloroflexi bacterium]|nr:metal ABC transporter permease [Chloroflexota bacterium]